MVELIAEIGQNHNGDMGLAKELIQAAKDAGADVAKFQLFDALATFGRDNNPWFDYNCQTQLSRDQVDYLAAECESAGIEFMSSVFDVERIPWLEDVGVTSHKVASRSVRDTALLAALGRTGKRLIVSLGMWDGDSFPNVPSDGPVDYLYCISKYPTSLEDVHLAGVDFTKYAGFSDHTIGITAPCAAMARGAKVIEKHFTLDRSTYGPDHEGSMTPDELRALDRFRKEVVRCL